MEKVDTTAATTMGKGAVGYVKMMSNNFGIDHDHDAVKEFLKTASDLTAQEINKGLLKIKTDLGDSMKKTMTEEGIKFLREMGASRGQDYAKSIEDRMNSFISEGRNLYATIEQKLQSAAKERLKLNAVKNQDVDFEAQVKEVLQNPFYSLNYINKDCISLFTQEVVMKFQKKSSGIDHEVNMGQFEVLVYPLTGKILIKPYLNNIYSGGYPHPHIKSSGDVCWGNAFYDLEKLAKEFNMIPVMSSIEALLQTYNEDSPYQDLSFFADVRARKEGLNGKMGWLLVDKSKSKPCSLYVQASRVSNEFYHTTKQDLITFANNGNVLLIAYYHEGRYCIEMNDGTFNQIQDFNFPIQTLNSLVIGTKQPEAQLVDLVNKSFVPVTLIPNETMKEIGSSYVSTILYNINASDTAEVAFKKVVPRSDLDKTIAVNKQCVDFLKVR